MTDPLELHGDNHRVRFADTLETHTMTMKLQAVKVRPLDLQLVVDVIPKLMLTARKDTAAKLGQKPTPKAYLHLGEENQTDADKLLVLAFMTHAIVCCGGKLVSRERLALHVEETAKRIASEVSYATFSALEKIADAKQGLMPQAEAA